jgi:hypothetical protein
MMLRQKRHNAETRTDLSKADTKGVWYELGDGAHRQSSGLARGVAVLWSNGPVDGGVY